MINEEREYEQIPGGAQIPSEVAFTSTRGFLQPTPEQILQAWDDATVTEARRSYTSRVYGGGGARTVVEELFVVSGDRVCHEGRECKVVGVLRRARTLHGVGIAKVQVVDLKDGNMTLCYVVPEGATVQGFKYKALGKLIRTEKGSVIARPAFTCMSIDPTYPVRSTGFLCGLVNRFKEAKYKLGNLCCCRVKRECAVVIDNRILSYLHDERLGAMASMSSEATFRILYASALKKFGVGATDTTIKTTVRHFVISSSAYAPGGPLSATLIHSRTNVPDVFDSRVVILETGGGELLSEEDGSSVPIVDNGNLKLKESSKGVTFEHGILKFDTPFSQPASIYHVGPAIACAATKNTTKSTHNQERAFLRLTNSRKDEKEYRCNADFLLFCIMDNRVEDPRRGRDRLIRELLPFSRNFGAYSPEATWGLKYSEMRKFRLGLSNERLVRADKTHHALGQYGLHVSNNINPQELAFCNGLPLEEMIPVVADEPHPKRSERMATLSKMEYNPRLYDPKTWPTFVNGKVKWEVGKFGKLSRQYVSLDNKCALEWLRYPMEHKHAMASPIVVNNNTYEFIPDPSQGTMDRWATIMGSLSDPTNRGGFAFFHSDDSIFSAYVSIAGVPTRIAVCIDIAKCDLSHSPALFVLVAGIAVGCGFDSDRVMSLFMQLHKDILIKHPDRKVDEFGLFSLKCLVLMSGSVLTTLINNYASLIILTYILEGMEGVVYNNTAEVKQGIIELAKEAGYEITLDAYIEVQPGSDQGFAKLTFLKHFPVKSKSGQWVAMKDMATLLRSMGFSDEPCVGAERVKEIFQGWNSTHHNPFIDLVYEKLGLVWPEVEDFTREYVSADSYVERYDTSEVDLHEAFGLIVDNRDRCVFISHPAFDALLRVGYALPRVHELEPRLPERSSELQPVDGT